MKSSSNAVRLLECRIRRYGNMAGAFRSLNPQRKLYIAHKISRVVPNLMRARAKALQGTRGICDRCGDEIPEARLKVVPGAIRCVACQRKSEKDSG